VKIKLKIFLTYIIFLILITGVVTLFYYWGILNINIEENKILILILISAAVLIPLIYTIFISVTISENIKQIAVNLKNFFSYTVFPDKLKLKINKKDEFGSVYKALSVLLETYFKNTEFAENLKLGNLKAKSEVQQNEQLGVLLVDIKENLLTYEKERRLNMLELERNNWYQSGVTDFTLLLQQDYKSTEEMAYPVIKKLAEHLRAEQAGIFVLKEKGDKELLILEAAYAYDKKKQLDTEVEIGESLVGKCAKEQKLIRIDDLPEGYTYISSGLGEDTPSSLILMPLIYEKRLFGVVEIASLKRITDYRVNFLNVIAERIAAEISNINTKILTTKLAEDSQKQTEELAIKEKQSEKTISALSKEKEQLNFKLNKLSENLDLINTIIPKVIFNPDGKISEINKAAKTLYGFKEELNSDKKTANIFEKNEKFQEIFKKVLSGETMINRYFRNNNTEELFEKFIPVKNSENKVETIILIAELIKTP